jgi:hypothetical protein
VASVLVKCIHIWVSDKSVLQVVEHPVDDDPAHTDKHPDGEYVTGETSVPIELAGVGSSDDDDDKRDIDRREDDVRNEDGEVECSRPVVMRVGDRSHVDVVDQVGCEEEHAADQCGDHHFAVGFTVPSPDSDVAEQEEDGTDPVQCGVQGWKIGE